MKGVVGALAVFRSDAEPPRLYNAAFRRCPAGCAVFGWTNERNDLAGKPMVLLAVSVKLLAEIALTALIGRGALGLLAGPAREHNGVYRLFVLATDPVLRVTRRVTPRALIDGHVPWVAGLLLSMVWLAALALKVHACIAVGMAGCR